MIIKSCKIKKPVSLAISFSSSFQKVFYVFILSDHSDHVQIVTMKVTNSTSYQTAGISIFFAVYINSTSKQNRDTITACLLTITLNPSVAFVYRKL